MLRQVHLLAFAIGLLQLAATSPAAASVLSFSTVPGATVAGNSVSARADLTLENGLLTIVLTNTANSTPARAQRLTNFEFNVSDDYKGESFTVIGVDLADGSSLVNATNPNGTGSTDISGGWVFGEDVLPDAVYGGSPFDFGVSATAFEDGSGDVVRFDGDDDLGNRHDGFGPINGGNWGLVGASIGSGSFDESVRNSVVIKLQATGDFDLSYIESAVFTYGSERYEENGTVVTGGKSEDEIPEPTSLLTMAVLAGCVGGYGAFRHKRNAVR